MKAILSKQDLSALMGKIQGIVPAKPSLPILSNILLEAIDDELVLNATDLSVSMKGHLPARVIAEGGITLPARRLFQLVRELTTPQVEIHALSPEVAVVNAGASHFRIQGMDKNEFPSFPDLSEGVSFSLSSATLKEMLGRTSFAAAREDSRQILNGILLELSQTAATFMGTDGKRLARMHTSIDSPVPTSGQYILPIKAVEEIIKMIDNNEDPVKLTLLPDKVAIEAGPFLLIAKLLSGPYPDVGSIIPAKTAQSLSLHREELISLLRQVAIFTSEQGGSVRFTFTPGTLHISATSGEIGEGTVSMPVNYAGSKLEIAFNPHYFLDMLRHTKDETVHFDVTDTYNPGLVTDSSSAEFMIMPMRLDE